MRHSSKGQSVTWWQPCRRPLSMYCPYPSPHHTRADGGTMSSHGWRKRWTTLPVHHTDTGKLLITCHTANTRTPETNMGLRSKGPKNSIGICFWRSFSGKDLWTAQRYATNPAGDGNKACIPMLKVPNGSTAQNWSLQMKRKALPSQKSFSQTLGIMISWQATSTQWRF